MRMHIELDDELIAEVDRITGPRGRSADVRSALETAVARSLRERSLAAAAGALADTEHEWDADPAQWVHDQRHGDHRRVG